MKRATAIVAYVCAAMWSAVLLGAALCPATWHSAWMSALTNGVCNALAVSPDGFVAAALPWCVAVGCYALLALLWQWAVSHQAISVSVPLAHAVACAVLVGGVTVWWLLLAQVGGVLLGVVCAALWRFAWVRFPRVFNRETVSYVVFGVLTTVVNIVSYMITVAILPFGAVMNTAVANAVAWVLSVLFAYVVNKLFVFQSHTKGAKALLWEAGKFVGARVFSFGVDEVGMLLLVSGLHVPDFWAKVVTNVLVMIMNYFFSKLIIFKGSKE